jgi:hypothetical protein
MSAQNNHRNRPAIPTRHLPVRPNLDQLKHQAKDLLRGVRRGDPSAIEEFNSYHPRFTGDAGETPSVERHQNDAQRAAPNAPLKQRRRRDRR